MSGFPRVAALKSVEAFQARLTEIGAPLACDAEVLAAPNGPEEIAPENIMEKRKAADLLKRKNKLF